jgi:hypothetical protein
MLEAVPKSFGIAFSLLTAKGSGLEADFEECALFGYIN